MKESIKGAVLRALEARMAQCKIEMELCAAASNRPNINGTAFSNIVNEHHAYWSGELAIAIGAHVEIAGVQQ